MKKLSFGLFIIISIFLTGVAGWKVSLKPAAYPTVFSTNTDTLNRLGKAWVKKQNILDERAGLSGFESLHNKQTPAKETEIRIWTMGGSVPLRGIILKRKKGEYSAFSLPAIDSSDNTEKTITLKKTKPEWESIWKKLESENILTLSDETELGKPEAFNDGQDVIIEVSYEGRYRIYGYTEPISSDFREARNVVNITDIIEDKLGVGLYAYPK